MELWNIFNASCEHTPVARIEGHLGDGLHAAGFLKHQRARHRFLYESGVLGVDEEENLLFSITDLVFGYHCKLHVGANAVKWALANFSCEAV